MKKFILKLDLGDDREKRKAMKIVAAFLGIDEITIDMKGKTLTIIGRVDPVCVVCKLRKFWEVKIMLLGPKEEPKKKEPKKEDKKEEEKKSMVPTGMVPCRPCYDTLPMHTFYEVHITIEENPDPCVIC